MPNMQVKNVSSEAHRVYRRRAAEAGQSLQEYMLKKLEADASKPTMEEWLRRIESRPKRGTRVTTEDVVRIIREDRDSH